MKTTLSILILATAVASQASAAEIRVNIVGKSPAEVRAEIQTAADKVCNAAYRDGHVTLQELSACSRIAADDGLAQAKAYETRTAQAAIGPVASNAAADAGR